MVLFKSSSTLETSKPSRTFKALFVTVSQPFWDAFKLHLEYFFTPARTFSTPFKHFWKTLLGIFSPVVFKSSWNLVDHHYLLRWKCSLWSESKSEFENMFWVLATSVMTYLSPCNLENFKPLDKSCDVRWAKLNH